KDPWLVERTEARRNRHCGTDHARGAELRLSHLCTALARQGDLEYGQPRHWRRRMRLPADDGDEPEILAGAEIFIGVHRQLFHRPGDRAEPVCDPASEGRTGV